MSHNATNWAVRVRGIKPAAKVVLWHLADRHNRDTGRCDPEQATLAKDCEMSRASINTHLSALEGMGFIKRIQRVNSATKRQKSTAYILNFDVTEPLDTESRVQNLDMEAVSNFEGEPCPENGESRVQILDTNPVREPGKNQKVSFDAFWGSWPNKVGKDKARKAWKQLSQQNRALAYERLETWWPAWRKEYPDANPIHASTYLNGKRWEDDYGQSEAPRAEISDEVLREYGDAINRGSWLAKHASSEIVSAALAAGYTTPEQCRRAGV